MDGNFNYSGFIDFFMESDDDFESYGVETESLELLESQQDTVSTEQYVLGKSILGSLD